jgi:hypothetical protein
MTTRIVPCSPRPSTTEQFVRSVLDVFCQETNFLLTGQWHSRASLPTPRGSRIGTWSRGSQPNGRQPGLRTGADIDATTHATIFFLLESYKKKSFDRVCTCMTIPYFRKGLIPCTRTEGPKFCKWIAVTHRLPVAAFLYLRTKRKWCRNLYIRSLENLRDLWREER